MSRIGLLSVSALALLVAGSVWTAPNALGQMFVGTPTPAQFTGPAQPSTQNGEWPTNAAVLLVNYFDLKRPVIDALAPALGKRAIVDDTQAFFRRGQYAGVSGTVELEIQPFKLGDTDDPNNKGDQPTGEPITVTGTFAAKAVAYPFEKM